MFDEIDLQYLFEATEPSVLRSEALDLFDRCLTENDSALMIAFIERQIAQEPPPLQLLRAMDEDLQQRMHALRAHRFDLRCDVVKAFAESTQVDITPLMPLSDIGQYHLLETVSVIGYVQERTTYADDSLLVDLLQSSIETITHLQRDIQLATEIHRVVSDWLEALSTTVGRRYWSDAVTFNAIIH